MFPTKNLFLVTFLVMTAIMPALAADSLQKTLPLLQKRRRTAAESHQVLTIFRTAKDPDTVFAAGASLVKTPPAKAQEPALFNLIIRPADPLKQTFAAVIITAMGQTHEELLPILEQALTCLAGLRSRCVCVYPPARDCPLRRNRTAVYF